MAFGDSWREEMNQSRSLPVQIGLFVGDHRKESTVLDRKPTCEFHQPAVGMECFYSWDCEAEQTNRTLTSDRQPAD